MADGRPPASVAFDRAAAYYDATRQLSVETAHATTELLLGELHGRGPVLEIGVGTGRIALPLAARDVPMVGVDLSGPMLARLQENQAAGRARVHVALADAVRLPLPGGAVGGCVVCHVLHLIPAWVDAVAELVRVTRPGGVVLVDRGGFVGEVREIQQYLASVAGIERVHPGLTPQDDLDAVFAAYGARPRVLPTIVERRTVALDGVLALFEANQFSWTWSLDDDERRQAVAATRAWAEERFGDLDEPKVREHSMTWVVYDLP